jgi:hypothetical protein
MLNAIMLSVIMLSDLEPNIGPNLIKLVSYFLPMDQHALKNINNCLNTNIYSYLETSGGQSSNPYLNVVHF